MTIIKPHTDIIKYIKTYMNRIYFNKRLKIKSLEKQHRARSFLLHQKADSTDIDIDAISYCFLRLPRDIFDIDHIILTPSMEMVIDDIRYSELKESKSAARRRQCYRTRDLSIMTLQSFSDIHDIIPIITAFQIEYNKMHEKLKGRYFETEADLASILGLSMPDVERLRALFGGDSILKFRQIAKRKKAYTVKLKTRSKNHYDFHSMKWALHIYSKLDEYNLEKKDIYIVSSNLHAMVNLIGGYARKIKSRLVLSAQDKKVQKEHAIHAEDMRYYSLKTYMAKCGESEYTHKLHHEANAGIHTLRDYTIEHLQGQLIDLAKIDLKNIDPRLKGIVKKKNAIIINIDYPFGDEAYYACKQLFALLGQQIKGVFVMGKAGALAGKVGDIIIPSAIYDEVSDIKFLINNTLTTQARGQVHKDCTVAAVHGTVLNNLHSLQHYHKQSIDLVEMESGPFLKAIYDYHFKQNRAYSSSEIDLTKAPCKMGFIYYASDAPLHKGETLGAGSLALRGIEGTYNSAIAILKAIYK